MQEEIKRLFENNYTNRKLNKKVIIFGTGTLALEVYKLLVKKSYNVLYFLNKGLGYPNAVGNLGEIKIIGDSSIEEREKSEATIIIAAFTTHADIHNIIKKLQNNGYFNIVTFAELIEIFEGEINGKFYLDLRRDFIKNQDQIMKICNIWSDNKSYELYKSIIKFRLSKKYENLLPKDELSLQYFPEDIKFYNDSKIRFIDCGAYDGDTIEALSKNVNNLDSIVAFEPDCDNYKKILKRLKDVNDIDFKLSILPCAVYCNETQMHFNNLSTGGSSISESGTTIVQCISIDESLINYKPTNIKMDIEGSEYEALLGAKNTICNEKPNLAISVYHKPSDFYTIPILLSSWNLGYKFYLRMYGYSGYDLVLYAIN